MRKYRANATAEQKEKIKTYDRQRKRKDHNVKASDYEASYYQILKNSKKIRDILGDKPLQFAAVLAHVYMKAIHSPTKSKIVREHFLRMVYSPTDSLCSTPPSSQFSSPSSNEINSQLRKLAVLRSKRKNGKAKKIAKDLMESVGSVAQIAELGHSTYSHIFRLIHTPKKRMKARMHTG